MSVKSVLGVVTGFLAHHVADLGAVETALSGVLQALPINAETRAHIQAQIDTVSNSAKNIEAALAAGLGAIDGGAGDVPVEIKASDIRDAVAAYLAEHPAGPDASDLAETVRGAVADALPAAIAAYDEAHPVAGETTT